MHPDNKMAVFKVDLKQIVLLFDINALIGTETVSLFSFSFNYRLKALYLIYTIGIESIKGSFVLLLS